MSYSSSDASVATVSGSLVTLVGEGSTQITAIQDGDANYHAALPVQQLLVVSSSTRIIHLDGSLDFGEVIIGLSESRVLTITNTGNQPLTVSSVTLPQGFSASPTSGSVQPGASMDITIVFAPLTEGDVADEVLVVSDATSGEATINISGSGILITGMETPVAKGMLYPNPARDIVHIKHGSNPVEISMHDAWGRKIALPTPTLAGNGTSMIDIRSLASGTYILFVRSDNHVFTNRLIKIN